MQPFNPFDPQFMFDLRPAMEPPRSPLESRGRQTPLEAAIQVIFGNMVTRRKKNGDRIEIAIDRAYIAGMLRKQRMRCAVSGIAFDLTRQEMHERRPFAPSVDRIDSAKGYVPGNVRVVLSCVNYALNDWGTDHYRAVCHAVYRRDRDSEQGIMAGNTYRFSTRPLLVFEAPDLSEVGPESLLSLEDAQWLPELGQNFDDRDLWRACNSGRLRSSRPTGKMHFTTRAWVKDWVNNSCHGQESQHASSSSKTSTASGTALAKSALASARAKAARLKHA